MIRLFSQYWWTFLLRGIVALLLGLMALFMPGPVFAGLVIFFGIYMFIDGIFSIVTAISNRKELNNWGWLLFSGIIGILIGIATFYNPFATAIALVYLAAFWALLSGIAEITIAIRLRKVIKGEGWYIAAGILTILFGVLILLNPVAGAFTLTFIFGMYAILIGILFISLSIRLKQRQRRSGEGLLTA